MSTFPSRYNPSVYNAYRLPIRLPFMSTEAAFDRLFCDMCIAPSSDILPNMLAVIPLPDGAVPLASVI
jgi:hypothetical protein